MNPFVGIALAGLALLIVGGVAMFHAASRNSRYDAQFEPFQMSDEQVRDEFDRILARTWGPVR